MSPTTRNIAAIALAGMWITLSEFMRNEYMFKQYWIEHYQSLGLTFTTFPVNGILWVVWSFFSGFYYLETPQPSLILGCTPSCMDTCVPDDVDHAPQPAGFTVTHTCFRCSAQCS